MEENKNAVLDANGLEVVIFNKGLEDMAQNYCDMLNEKEFDNMVDSLVANLRKLHSGLQAMVDIKSNTENNQK